MQISVNNEIQQVPENSRLVDLLEQLQYDSQNVAVAINTDFVPRGNYAAQVLQAGDKVDIVAPIQGG